VLSRIPACDQSKLKRIRLQIIAFSIEKAYSNIFVYMHRNVNYLQFALQALDVLNCKVQHVRGARLLWHQHIYISKITDQLNILSP